MCVVRWQTRISALEKLAMTSRTQVIRLLARLKAPDLLFRRSYQTYSRAAGKHSSFRLSSIHAYSRENQIVINTVSIRCVTYHATVNQGSALISITYICKVHFVSMQEPPVHVTITLSVEGDWLLSCAFDSAYAYCFWSVEL